MNSIRRIASSCAAAGLAAWLASCPGLRAQEPAQRAVLDTARPETWADAVAELKRQQKALVRALISATLDKDRATADRRKAVFSLSALRGQESLRFMVEHVSLRLPGSTLLFAEDWAKETPAAYALSERRDWGAAEDMRRSPVPKRTDWRSAQAIIDGVQDGPRTPDELLDLAHALRIVLGRDLAVVAVDDALKRRAPPTGHWRNNLTEIKKYVQK